MEKKVCLEVSSVQAQLIRSALVIYMGELVKTAADAIAHRPYDFDRMTAFIEKAKDVDFLHSYVCKESGIVKITTK